MVKRKGLKELVILCLLVLANICYAAESSSSNYQISAIELSAGGNASSANYKQHLVIEDVTGNVSSANYRNNVGFFYTIGGAVIGITTEILSPLDHWLINESMIAECNASSDIGLSNITLWTNYSGEWKANITSAASGLNSEERLNITNLPEKSFVLGCYGCDDNGECGFSSNRTVTVDITKPEIGFVPITPANNSINTTTNNNAYINISVSDNYNNYSAFIDWNKSLVGWWRFEGNYNDSSSYGNNGNQSGPTARPRTTTGARGKAYDFDGNNDYIEIQDNDLYEPEDITIEAWINPRSFASSPEILAHYIGASTDGYYLFIRTTGKLAFAINNSCEVSPAVAVPLNKFSYIAAVFEDSSDTIKTYLNGKEISSGSCSHHIGSPTNNIRIGVASHTLSQFFSGKIDEVRIWNRRLSANEINASYQAGLNSLNRNYTDLDSGVYRYKAYIIDKAGNLNATEERTFRIYPSDTPTSTRFIIRNRDKENVASIDNKGNMYLKKAVFEQQPNLDAPPRSFIVKNKSKAVVAYINSSGYLFLSGQIFEETTMNPAGNNFLITNSSKDIVGYFDQGGNVRLRGLLYQDYSSP